MKTQKKVGLITAISTTVGLIVATSCLISLGTGVSLAGKAFVIPLVAVFVLNIFIAFSFAELNALMPNVTGGLGQYTLAAFGPGLSIISTVATYVICTTLAAGVEASMFGLMLQELFGMNAIVSALGILVLMLAINIMGIKSFAAVQNTAVFLLIGSMVVMAIMGLCKISTGEPLTAAEIQEAPFTSMGDLLGLSALAFWLFIGVEFVIPIAKDLKNPERNIPLAMIIGLVILVILQGVMAIGMANYVPLDVLGSDLPHISYAVALTGEFGRYWMGFVTILAAVSSLNSILSGCSRIVCGLAQGGLAPKFFAKENKRHAPVVALTFITLILAGIISTGITSTEQVTFLILAASCFWLIGYIICHMDVVKFRKQYPEKKRSFVVRMFYIPQVIGIIGCVYMIWNIDSDPARKLTIFKLFGIVFALLVAYSAIWVKVVMKKKYFGAYGISMVMKMDRDANPDYHLDGEEPGNLEPADLEEASLAPAPKIV